MANLLVNSVTYHTPQKRQSDTIMHVTLNTIHGLVESKWNESALNLVGDLLLHIPLHP